MSALPVDVAGPLAGRTTIRAQALRALARAIVADAAGVPPGRAAVTLNDDGGSLVVVATVPAVVRAGATSLVERGAEIRDRVAGDLTALAGRTAGRVDLRFSGIFRPATGRAT